MLLLLRKGELFSINVNSVPAAMTCAGPGATRTHALLNFSSSTLSNCHGEMYGLFLRRFLKYVGRCVLFRMMKEPQWVEIKSIGTTIMLFEKS